MAEDVETPSAESSPAASPAPEPAEEFKIPTDPEAYAKWRQTGELSGEKQSSEGDESATSQSKSAGDKKPEKAAPASDAGKDKRQDRSNADTRKEELNREIRELLAKRDSLRQEVEPGTGKKDVKAEPSPAPDQELKRPQRPKQEDFNDWDSFEKAQDKYLEDLADFKASQRLEEHTQRQRHQAQTQEMQKRLDEAKERYGADAEEAIVGTAKNIFADDQVAPALKAAITRSPVIVDALYVMGSDADELSAFLELAKNDPLEALRKWFTVEALVQEELKSGNPAKGAGNGSPARGPDGKFLPPEKEKPAKREAPSPPRELGGNTSPPGDERDRAAKNGDFRAFKAAADRLDAQRFRGQ